MRMIALSLLLGAFACGAEGPDPPPACVQGYPSLTLANLNNTWWDDGKVKPPRTYAFRLDSTFTTADLVAPCPAGETCVWSGVVENTGRVTLDDSAEQLTLVYDMPMQTYAGLSFPTTLTWSGDCGRAVLTEADTQRSFRIPTR